MEFVASFVNSIRNLPWLKAQRVAVKRAWRYFLVLSFFLTVLALIPVAVVVPQEFKKLSSVVAQAPSFEARIAQGELTVRGVPQPFVYQHPASNFVVVVNTATSTALASYLKNEQQNGLLVARDRLELYDANSGMTRTQSWSGFPTTTITRETLITAFHRFSQPQWIVFFSAIFLVGAYVGTVVGKLFVVVLVVTIVRLVGALGGRAWKWRELLTVGLFGVTLPAIIELVVGWVGGGPAYLFFLAYLAFMLAVVFTKDSAEEVVKTKSEV